MRKKFRFARITGSLAMGAAVASAAVAVLGAPASADTTTSGAFGLLSGNQILAPISVPIDVCGNGIGILGQGFSGGCRGGAGVVNNF